MNHPIHIYKRFVNPNSAVKEGEGSNKQRQKPCQVAQTGSLLYRRMATCEGRATADCQAATQKVSNLRDNSRISRMLAYLAAVLLAVCSCLNVPAAVVPSEAGHVKSLDGIWRFKLEQPGG